MAMTMIEKILANHSGQEQVKPGEIADIELGARIARDFGGGNVVKSIIDNGLTVEDPPKPGSPSIAFRQDRIRNTLLTSTFAGSLHARTGLRYLISIRA